ncbi:MULTISPECIES: hypothetical protein [Streptomyces]|nr:MULTISPECIES: hypothetical protein [Streptomyces]
MGSRMARRPDPELTAQVRPDGYLELFSRRTGKRHRCGPRGTTMWLALQRSGWEPELAADEISLHLGVDPDSIRCDIEAWLAHFREAAK